MEPVNLDKSEPVNVGPIQSGRPKRPRKPRRQRPQKGAAGSPDPMLTIIAIAASVILLVGGSFAVRLIIDTAGSLCTESSSGDCSGPGLSTGYDVPIFQ
ncbi:hypothetical protein ACWGJ9_11955 [Curtobacterium citreum]